jgi:hypothetical protein
MAGTGGPLPFPADAGRRVSCPILFSTPSQGDSWITRVPAPNASDSVDYDFYPIPPLRLTSRFRDVNGSRFFQGGASCGFPRRKNVVTRTLRWSGVRMEQPDPRHFASSQPQSRSAYAREHVSSGLAQRNPRSRRGASARGFHHFPGQPCSFRRDCAYASRYVRVLSPASGGKRCGGGCVAGASGARELRLRLTNLLVSSATTPTRRRVGANTPPAPRPVPKNGI